MFNTDQGAQFTGEAFTGKLEQHGIQVSMDGRGRALPAEAERGLRRYFRHYNHERPHQALGYRTPAEVHATGALWKTGARETEPNTELSCSGLLGC